MCWGVNVLLRMHVENKNYSFTMIGDSFSVTFYLKCGFSEIQEKATIALAE